MILFKLRLSNVRLHGDTKQRWLLQSGWLGVGGGARNCHLKAIDRGLGDRSAPEAKAVCRHCLQILTAEMIKI